MFGIPQDLLEILLYSLTGVLIGLSKYPKFLDMFRKPVFKEGTDAIEALEHAELIRWERDGAGWTELPKHETSYAWGHSESCGTCKVLREAERQADALAEVDALMRDDIAAVAAVYKAHDELKQENEKLAHALSLPACAPCSTPEEDAWDDHETYEVYSGASAEPINTFRWDGRINAGSITADRINVCTTLHDCHCYDHKKVLLAQIAESAEFNDDTNAWSIPNELWNRFHNWPEEDRCEFIKMINHFGNISSITAYDEQHYDHRSCECDGCIREDEPSPNNPNDWDTGRKRYELARHSRQKFWGIP